MANIVAHEEEYFARLEFEKRKQLEAEKQKKLMAQERQQLKELHHMRCPKCGMQLIEVDYRDHKIDKCSACSGVWLDAGELESLGGMEKSGLDKLFSVFRK
jgi:uncharacterized paraquat-inducible protein A